MLTKSASATLSHILHDFLKGLYPISPSGKRQPLFLVHYTSLDTLFSPAGSRQSRIPTALRYHPFERPNRRGLLRRPSQEDCSLRLRQSPALYSRSPSRIRVYLLIRTCIHRQGPRQARLLVGVWTKRLWMLNRNSLFSLCTPSSNFANSIRKAGRPANGATISCLL